MPTDAMVRPSQLDLCEYEDRDDALQWSPSSDSGDDDSNDSTESNSNDDEQIDEPPARPLSLGVRPSPLRSPLANSSPLSASRLGGAPPSRPRIRLSPLAPVQPGATARPALNLPKSQPLSRSLLARAVSGASAPEKPKKSTKVIVPTKPFRTTFELGLTNKEIARKP